MTIIVNVLHGADKGMNAALKKQCQDFCKKVKLSASSTDAERGQVNQNAVDMLADAYPHHNVMLVHPLHKKQFDGDYTQIELQVDPRFGSFQVYVFKSGKFTLQGDGGYINWCFKGNYTRNDKNVTFKQRG
ncbi:hypothetical protein M758_1G262000 [Ceratodon purpureus]|nr:hypothetical protein M758_1G262000 [Ceratodon purpureus]